MSNAKRPTTARKVTPKDKAAQQDALDSGVRFRLDQGGEWFYLRPADVTPALAREVRGTTGRSFMRLMAEMVNDPDIDVLSDAVWVARRIKGDDVEHEDVTVSYSQLLSDGFDIDDAGPSAEEDDSDPEA